MLTGVMIVDMKLSFILLMIIIIYYIWKYYNKRKPFKTFKQFRERALEYEMKGKYENALEIRNKALELNNLTNLERADLYLGIGEIHLSQKDYQKATEFFDLSFDIAINENFPYDKQYEKIIDAYLKAGRKNDAKIRLAELIERQRYDKRFKKLENFKCE